MQQDFEFLLRDLPEIHSLSPTDEQKLAAGKDDTSKETLVLAHMREAFYYTRHVCRGKIEDGDLYSLCYKALVECAKNFHPGATRFFAYAKANLRGNISRHWKNLDVVKNASEHEVGGNEKYAPCRAGDDDTDQVRFDETNDVQVLSDTSLEPQSVDPDFASIELRERLDLLKPIMEKKLSEQERMVLDLTYTGGYNFEQIGTMLSPKVSRSAVQQTHARAILKLRNELARQKKLK